MNTDYFSGIKIFMAVVETQSFSKASLKVGLTQSAVSKSIATLEDRLNTPLFNRTTRQVKLTEAGKSYYESCIVAVEELVRAEENLKSTQSVKGIIRLDLPVLYGKKKLLPVILKIAKKYPDVEFAVNFTNRAVDLIDENVDLVIRIGNLSNNAGLKARYIGKQSIVTCATPDYLRQNGHPKTPKDLKNHECILNLHQNSWLFQNTDQKTQKVSVEGRLKLEGIDSCVEASLAGHGLVQVPYWLVEDHIKTKKLISVLEETSMSLPIHALWLNSKQKTSKKISVIINEFLESTEIIVK